MRILTVLALAAAASSAIADEPIRAQSALTASLGSYHFERGKKRCEINPGIGIELGTGSWRGGIGSYQNSECRPSWYIGGADTWAIAHGWHIGGGGAFLFGYQEEKKQPNGERRLENRVLFAPMALVGWEGKLYGFDVGYIPPAGNLVFLRVKMFLERVPR